MSRYYYIASSFPSLEFPSIPEISFIDLKESLKFNLSTKDYRSVQALRLFVDISNIRPLLLEEEVDTRGNLTEKELDEALLVQDFLPQYVFDYLNKYETLAEKLKHFPELLAAFFKEQIREERGFLREYFLFEREWRLVILALRAKVAGRDIVKELQFEDFTDPLVSLILAQKDADQFDPPEDYKELKEKFLSCGPDPWQQHKMIAAYRYEKIQEMIQGDQFSMDFILAYLAQLFIVEYWNELDEQRGIVILDTFKSS
ncbi:MAG: DUF2764 family protein [Chlamydiae bacterium]|nr:DUF2764 family protein [Chlamydiota bacterium]